MKRIPLVCLVILLSVIASALAPRSRATFDSTNLIQLPQTESDKKSSSTMQVKQPLIEQGATTDKLEFVPGEVLVGFKNSADAKDIVAARKALRGTLLSPNSDGLTKVFERFGVGEARKSFAFAKARKLTRIVKFTSAALHADAQETLALVAALQAQPEVEFAELNMLVKTQMVPNDPYYSSAGAWGQSFQDLWGLQKLNAATAWDSSQGDNVVVAVVDSGLDYNHEDIATNVWQNAGETGTDTAGRDKRTNGIDDDANGFVDDWHGWDFVTIDGTPADNDPMDDHGHGTHVSGTIAAVGNNGLGVIGVAPRARIMALKGLDANGNGSIEDLCNAIVYAADNGAGVINNSWGGGTADTPQTLIDAIAYAHDTKGAVVVAAAGNNNSDVGIQARGFYPACIRDVIAVAAVDHTDAKASFSNYGAKIDVAAPGGGDLDPTGLLVQPNRTILSLLSSQANSSMTSSGQLVVGAKYLRQTGTSMAAPHVAGAAALIRSLHPEFTPEQVRQALRHASDDLGAAGFDTQAGYGRLNAARALTEASPLMAQLTQPTGTLTGLTQVNITGTAAGQNLASWRLEYGSGTAPTSWTLITSSTLPVTEGMLATWNISNVPDGTNTIRLVAQNTSGQTYEDRLSVSMDNVVITDPLAPVDSPDLKIFRGGQTISISGTAASANFSNFTITITGTNSGTLNNPAVTLTNNGLAPVRNGVLATWNTTGVAADRYRIYLTEYTATGASVQKDTRVLVDPTLHPGWPQTIPYLGDYFSHSSFADQITTADINGDGAQDIVAGYNNLIHVFAHTGAELPGWPQTIDPQSTGAHTQRAPAVADLDGDGSPEIIAANDKYQVFIFRANGSVLPGWPKPLGGVFARVAVDDLNGDGVKEIIVSTDSRIRVFDMTGALFPGFPALVATDLTPPAIGDVDGDGKKEIAVATTGSPTNLYLVSSNGTIMPGWPKAINPAAPAGFIYYSYPVLGDLDGDGDLECVMGSNDGKVYAFHHDGSPVAGWPQLTKNAQVNTPAIGDIDGDGKPEVVVGNDKVNENGVNADYLYAWHGDGTLLAGWPVKYDRPTSLSSFGFGPPALADIDQDGRPDVIVASDAEFMQEFALNAYKSDGTKVVGFPKPTDYTGSFSTCTVAIADMDGDGLLEMAWMSGTNKLFVWDLPTTTNALLPWPMYQHDARHSGLSTKLNEVIAPTVFINAPANGAYVSGTVNVQAQASDNVGVARVEFYLDAALVSTDKTSPYSFAWDTRTGPDGAHTLTSKAYDATGNVGASPAVNATVDNTAPSVSLTSPASGARIGGSVTINSQATDAAGVSRVEFYLDATLLGTDNSSPYSFIWNTRTTSDGPHTLTSKAYDTVGNVGTSSGVAVTVDNAAPSTSITAPASNAYVSGTAGVSVQAADNTGVMRVELYRGASLIGTLTTSPYNFSWDTRTASDGTQTLTSKAYDAVGNVGNSAAVSVKVDNTAPTVSLTAPVNGAALSGTAVTVSANASDTVGVSKVDFYRDGSVLIGTDSSSPYSITWNSTSVASGTHTLLAICTDFAGNTKTSATITITVDNTAPTVTITSPANGATVTRNTTVNINANASDNVAVTKVEFYVAGALKCTDTAAPYTCAWVVPNVRTTYQLQAKAYDARANTATSTIVSVTSK